MTQPDIVAELDRWLSGTLHSVASALNVNATSEIDCSMVQRARDEIVVLRDNRNLWLLAQAQQRGRDEEIALRYTGESYVAELIANAIHNQDDET